MSNSPLVNYTQISPNSTNPRNNTIKKITPHHMAGNLTVETCGNVFAPSSRQASSNYGIGTDGRVGMYVEEKNRAWTSGNAANDHQAVTIEVANDEIGGNWHVSDKALAKLIDLCVDICQRNGIAKLVYTGDATGNLTHHNMFEATSCPGPYLQSKMPYIAEQVNKRLGTSTDTGTSSGTTGTSTLYRVRKSATDSASQIGAYSSLDNAKKAAVGNTGYKVYDLSGNLVYDPGAATSTGTGTAVFTPYLVRVTASELNIRKGPGTGYGTNGSIKDKGTYTIVEEASGTGATKWGRLKSGAGWVSLDYAIKI